MDKFFVNILNEGRIPWINQKGPLFGYLITRGAYELLIRDPRISIEITTLENARIAKRKFEQKKKERMQEKLNIRDAIVITSEPKIEETKKEEEKIITEVLDEKPLEVENTQNDELSEEDEEIDSILNENKDNIPSIESKIPKEETGTSEFVYYSDEELSTMTKKQMKDILKSRGYTEGKYAGKYHDTVEILIKKVKETQ